jgi:hypothetical protein
LIFSSTVLVLAQFKKHPLILSFCAFLTNVDLARSSVILKLAGGFCTQRSSAVYTEKEKKIQKKKKPDFI